MFRRAREVADALKESPEVAATEYKANRNGVRVLFAVPDEKVGDLLRRLLERFRMEEELPEQSYRISSPWMSTGRTRDLRGTP
jgi:hypothetical protein